MSKASQRIRNRERDRVGGGRRGKVRSIGLRAVNESKKAGSTMASTAVTLERRGSTEIVTPGFSRSDTSDAYFHFFFFFPCTQIDKCAEKKQNNLVKPNNENSEYNFLFFSFLFLVFISFSFMLLFSLPYCYLTPIQLLKKA